MAAWGGGGSGLLPAQSARPSVAGDLAGVVVGLPALLSVMAASGDEASGVYGVALALAGMAIFGSIAAILVVGDTYWLVLRTRQSERRVLRSRDSQLISNLVALVAKAAEAARQRR
jgi:hypothetical protein